MKPLLLSLCLLLTLHPLSHADTYTVAAYAREPFIDKTRPDGGISIEIVRQALKTQGHDIQLRSVPWSRSLVLLEKGKIDILPAVWFTKERTQTMRYSEPYASNRLVFIKPKGVPYEYTGLASLHGKVVGVVRNYGYDEAFLQDNAIRFSISDSLISNVKKVINGRVDLTLDDEIAAKSMIPKDLLKKLAFTKDALNESPLYVTCNKSQPQCDGIIKAFNQGLETLRTQGKLNTILNNH